MWNNSYERTCEVQKHSILGEHLHFDIRGRLGYTEPLIYSGPRFILLHLDRFILHRVFSPLNVYLAALSLSGRMQDFSVQFSCSVVSNSLWPDGLQHARPPCPLPTPGVYSNSCPLNQWCHPTISSSVIPFSPHLQSFPASGSFQMSQFFTSGGQSIRVSASTSVLPVNIQDWFSLGLTGWISLQSKGLSRVFSNTTVQKHQFFGTPLSL